MPRIRRRRHPGTTLTPARPAAAPRVQVVQDASLRWYHIEAPGPEELSWLEEEFPFHELDIEDVRSRRQRPKVDEYPDYLFVVLHFPRYDKVLKRLFVSEVDAFIGQDFVVTVLPGPLKAMTAVFERMGRDEERRLESFAKGSGYLLYEILDAVYDACMPMLDPIGSKLDDIEDRIFDRHDDAVRLILDVKQEVIAFRRIVNPQRPVLRVLERRSERYLASDDLDVYYDDIIDKSERIWDVLDNYKEVIEALEGANEMETNREQNRILRILTVLSVIFLPPNLIAGIWGMNTHVPGEGTFSGFALVVLFEMVVLVGSVAYFKRWF